MDETFLSKMPFSLIAFSPTKGCFTLLQCVPSGNNVVVFGTDPERVNSHLDTLRDLDMSRHKSPAHYHSGSCATYSAQNIL